MDASAQADVGNITPIELQAELDTLRSLRRRSISQPSEGIDPDLPPSPSPYGHGSPPVSPTLLHPQSPVHALSSATSAAGAGGAPADALAGPSGTTGPHALGGRGFVGRHMQTSSPLQEINEDQPLADNLSELFWLPARLHPEIAPQEFRNFIRDQTRPENLLRRSGSQLGRRKSMLSRQYQPSESDTETPSIFTSDTESTPSTTPSISRYPSRSGSFRRNTGLERLTLADLQKLESIARQAAQEGQSGEEGEAQLKRLVRRSLSLNPAAILTAADQLKDDDSYTEDDTDSPLIVPPPGSILRRSARTKIRKDSLVGDGGGHRFRPSRRGSKLTDPALEGDDAGASGSTRRHASIGSLASVEDDRRNSQGSQQGERPVSGESKEGPSSPGRPQREAAPQAIPTQYVSPMSALTERLEAADLGPQGSDLLPMASTRSGADMPPLSKSLSPPQQQTRLTQEPEEIADSEAGKQQGSGGTGSLRTTKRFGAQPPPPSKLPVRSATSPPPPRSPPAVAGTPSVHQQQQPENPPAKPVKKPSGVAAALAQELDSRPALPKKVSTESWQAKKSDSAIVQQLPPAATTPTVQQTNGPAAGQVHQARLPSTQKAAPISAPAVQPPPSNKSGAPATRQGAAPSKAHGATPAPKEKEKKSAWTKLGLSRSSRDEQEVDDGASIASSASGGSTFGRKGKKTKKDSETPPEKRQTSVTMPSPDKGDKQESSGSGGFFGGLFGKKKAEPAEQAKKEAVQALPMHLQMPTPPPTASGMLTADGKYINFYRLPIHIERAVYRLSHIKLANPRRPLYEQVLISNLMFWYLGVINKPVVPPPQAQQRPPVQVPGPSMLQGIAPESAAANSVNPQQMRPVMVRETSNGYEAPERNPLAHEDAMPGNGQASTTPRPLSHPPSMVRSDEDTIDNEGFNPQQRIRPQTIPSGSQNDGQVPPRMNVASANNDGFNEGFQVLQRPHGQERQDETAEVKAPESNGRKSRNSPGSDDVHFDARRKTADLDTFDIISAYADEERRKSILAQQSAFAEEGRAGPQANPNAERRGSNQVSTRSMTAAATSEGRDTIARSTPPRQSSFSASASPGLPNQPRHQHTHASQHQHPHPHQHHHQHATLLPATSRQMSKSPPPRQTPSPSLQTPS